MNILFLNNYHYLRGGSERVFFDEMELLGKHGHKAIGFARKHAEDIPSEYDDYFPKDIKTDSIDFSWRALKTLFEFFYSGEAKRSLCGLLKKFPPDLAHAHNIYGRLTSSVLDLLTKMDIPVVMTLHDYKLICPNYKMLNEGKICEACKGMHFYMALKNKCHKNSFLASMTYMMESYFCHWLRKYTNTVSIFIAPSLFMKNKFIQCGWPEDQITYLPNFVILSTFEPEFTPGDYFLYLGRLAEEKGILNLINAFTIIGGSDARLLVVGEGHIRRQLEEKASRDARIRFTGYLSGNMLKETTMKSLAVIVPSEWYENAPMSVLEAFACGKPVIGARIGGITEMIEDGVNGYLFESGNVDDLREKLELMLSLPDAQIREMGKAARQKVEREYNSELHYERLMNIYHGALS